MRRNIGTADRVIRIATGTTLLALATLVSTTVAVQVAIGLAAAGAVLVTTSVTGYCPTYQLVGIDTMHGRIRRIHANV